MRKLIAFDNETMNALKLLASDRSSSLQELADEAFADLLKKYGRPTDLKDALRQSLARVPANDQAPSGERRGATKPATHPVRTVIRSGRAPRRKPSAARPR